MIILGTAILVTGVVFSITGAGFLATAGAFTGGTGFLATGSALFIRDAKKNIATLSEELISFSSLLKTKKDTTWCFLEFSMIYTMIKIWPYGLILIKILYACS
ncbi:hypothetical protein Lpar_1513 [Legionella parisiensis]|uniref:Uncharacterized protein n=1 Tax=Legionella parisiensis TaxID=45071 RepID=A0A1E5JQK6_9GAMM|nr:hypothetical protein Lpar_1513 [Legionella parisiensis]OEH46795.1 hypothetical protein lpari_02263 [Legionella parisiensis]STX77690.1 Uncharacterised protein [Legionella parisiensis]